jgi:lipopolysaccharide transport system permease protein
LHAVASPWRHRALIAQLVRREVLGRYRGSFFGLLWSFVNPVLMLTVYTFVFSVVFQARWGRLPSTAWNSPWCCSPG